MQEELPPLPDHHLAEKRRAGVCLPLWALLSEKSFEAGDIYSLEALLPWLEKTGFSIMQILPLNDCGFGSSPYSSLSSFAIDPLYISLHKLGITKYSRKRTIATHSINKKRITDMKLEILLDFYQKNIDKCNRSANEFIRNYPWVKPYLCFKYYNIKHNGIHWQDWEKIEGISGYSESIYANLISQGDSKDKLYFQAWLQFVAYEQLKSVKESYDKKGVFLKGDMPILTSANSCDVWAHRELYRMDLQTGAPPDAFSAIGQNWGFPILDWEKMESMEYSPWKERLEYQENFFHLYRIDHVIGIYRLWAIPLNAKSAKYGFFYPQKGVTHSEFIQEGLEPKLAVERNIISVMPSGIAETSGTSEATGTPGTEPILDNQRYYFHWDFHLEPGFFEYTDGEREKLYKLSFQNLAEDERYWKQSGEKILKSFQGFTTMFPCSEDLGSVPGFVRDSLHENRIFGIDVIRWTRSFDDGSYIPAHSYRRNALSTLSTHDTSLALEWWFHELKDGEKDYAIRYFLYPDPKKSQAKFQDGEALNQLADKSPSEVLHKLLEFAFQSRSQFSVQMLQDLLFTGDYAITSDWNLHKINTPATPEDKNWKYRFSFLVEDLLTQENLNHEIFCMLEESGRLA